jgi:GcrA cell cycle regulator
MAPGDVGLCVVSSAQRRGRPFVSRKLGRSRMSGPLSAGLFCMSWTDERIKRLKRLNDGRSAAAIAEELGGGTTRNAAISKLDRLGIPLASAIGNQRRPYLSARVSAERQRQAARSARKNSPPSKPPAADRFGARPPPTAANLWEPLPGAKPVSLLELTDGTCRWPLGSPTSGFCGCTSVPGLSWCETHMRRVFSQPDVTPRQRSTVHGHQSPRPVPAVFDRTKISETM